MAGSFDFDSNMGEQVGADPAGDQSTGNKPPNFGSQDIQITATVAGTPTNSSVPVLNGYLFYAVGD